MTAFPIDDVRGAFPALALTDHGRARAYLDNPAGTQVPQPVIEAVARCLTETNANLGGAFVTSKAADAVVRRAHAAMADLLGAASAQEVVIGPSMTSLTYRISRSLGRRLAPGDEIVVTRMDHDGNVAAWLQLAEDRGLVVRWLPFDRETWRIEPEALDHVLSEKTRILALNYASNLTGSVNDVAALAARAKAAGALVYVDAVQLAPHRLVDVAALGCDFLVCSSYKFFGPHLGILWGRGDLLDEMFPYQCRCASDESPKKFETGTPQIELLAGLAAAVDYVARLGERVGTAGSRRARIAAAYRAILDYECGLARRLIDGLGSLPGVRIQGITNSNRMADRVPTVSLVHDRIEPAALARGLADDGVFVWSGHNYALEVIRHLGIDETRGVLRIGLVHYNTEDDVARVLTSLENALSQP
jgi:cysteine desulfurase family protein (TIGR01976 family)